MSTRSGMSSSGGGSHEEPKPVRRYPTDSSFYDCHGVVNNKDDPNARDWHYARDVRAQVQAAPSPRKGQKKGYPSGFGNQEGLDLQASKPLVHTPIIPGTSQPYQSGPPGAHRVVYNDKDRSKCDVIYHDDSKPKSKNAKHAPFSKATYVPRASK
ncbi:hypothetical protein VTH82DRAFT_6505 [Thermothelomyces myriococcoides]